MRVGDFSLSIAGHTDKDGYVCMRHGEQYNIEMGNYSGRTTNVYVEVDGTSVGNFQIGSLRGISNLERSGDDRGVFTFFKVDSVEGGQAGLSGVSRDKQGLVQVKFVPELIDYEVVKMSSSSRVPRGQHTNSRRGPCGQFQPASTMEFCDDRSAGGTGLTGRSSQEFGRARYIQEDTSRSVTISLRLVHAEPNVRPLPGRVGYIPPPV